MAHDDPTTSWSNDPPPFQFHINQHVLCYYGNDLYEAKCLDHELFEDGEPIYKIHYVGWKKGWDEWVKADRLLVIDKTNLEHMERLKLSGSNKRKCKNSSKLDFSWIMHYDPSPIEPMPKRKGRPCKKRKTRQKSNQNLKINSSENNKSLEEAQETLVKDNTNFALAIQPKMNDLSSTPPCIELSLSLKKIIQMDFNMVNVFNKVSPYTQQYSVADIVSLYINKHPIISKPEAFEFGCFLIALFNLHVNTKLLYKNERYMNLTFKAAKYFNTKLRFIKKNDYTFVRFSFQKKMWCYVYPPIYLLRLFAQLPSTKVRMNGDKWLYFSHFVKDFIDYLDQYKTIFFTKYYFPMNKL